MDGTGLLFYRQVAPLARRFRVGTYALRDDARDMETLVADLRDVVVRMQDHQERAVLVAESFGGALAMSFALAHPTLVRALVILNSFPFFRPQHRLHLALAGLRVMPWGAMRIVRRLTAFRLHSRHTHRDEVRRFLQLTALTTRHGYRNRLRMLTRYDIRHRLPELRVPVLYLAADEDHLIPSVQQARLMASGVPNSTTIILRGHGHSCFLAETMRLDEVLREWAPTA
jgi:pimeloyl-ACP methyl ester carboxylesterase